MSSVFGAYAQYYDLLYRDKDYAGEAAFIQQLLRQHAPEARTVLELGCGTGTHAALLATQGYSLHGVDLSDEMLDAARQRTRALPADVQQRLSFSQGNARDCRVGRQFDVVLSLFHVVSYQSTNADLQAMFDTVAQHLKPGGVFIFDFWFGPAVLTDRPAVRIKRMASDAVRVTRLAEPVIDAQASCVDVNYQVMVQDLTTQAVTELTETHRMRYLFLTEIDLLARAAGFSVQASGEWLTGRTPDFDTWGVYSVLRK
jgi:SAM-dependent methyltransferase